MHWMKRGLLLSLLVLALPAEARQGATPRSWLLQDTGATGAVETTTFPAIDAAALRRKDAEAAPKSAGEPMRFAVPYAASISPARDGEWEVLENGDSLWRYRVEVPGATDLNLGFTQFHLPRGATLHLWSDDKERHYQGPYTAADNKAHGELWTPVLPGDRLIIELFVPAEANGLPILELGRIGAGFRDVFGLGGFAMPRQGSCNIDVVCPEGDDWRDQIRSVAVYQLGGQWTCTGSLLNDVPQSLTPYLLTAAHCGIGTGNASSMVVYWNFESPTCGSLGGGSLSENQSGASLLATRSDVDMALVVLDEVPAESFEVFYSGWDRSNTQPGGAVGIHHPSTDEKAISFANRNLTTTSSCIGSSTPSTHWTVPRWDLGTTEPGSSGSGLWNPGNRRLIGFLSGGTASCSNTTGDDCYGKLAVAWDGSSASSRLRDWLDPNSAAPAGVPGTDPSGFQIVPDAISASVCLPSTVSFQLDILRAGDFADSVTLSTLDLPGTFSVGFSANPVVPPAQSILTISNLVAGDHVFRVLGTSPESERQISLRMVVASGAPGTPAVSAPVNNAQDVGTSPRLEWSAASQAAQYEVEIATDPAFGNVAYAAVTNETGHTIQSSLAPATQYFVRVRAINDCGVGAWSPSSVFTTALEVCVSPNLLIPDDNPTGVSSTMHVDSILNIDQLKVAVDITHTWVGDLIVDLQHVDTGTTVRLFSRPGVGSSGTYGCSGDDLDVLFDDGASLAISSQCSSEGQAYVAGGAYRPHQPLSAFQGVPLAGDWRLVVGDHAGADIGTLAKWCLIPTLIDLDHTITVAANPATGGTVGGGGSYEDGDEVVVTAQPAEGWLFRNWTEGGQEVSTSTTHSFIATGSRTLTANFEQLGFLVTSNTGSARVGETVELTVQVVAGSGLPHPYPADICLWAGHAADAVVEILAGELADPSPGEEGSLCGTTDGAGRATFSLTTTTAGRVEVRAKSRALRDSEPLAVFFEAGEARRLLLDSLDEIVAACMEATVVIRLVDEFGNTVAGADASAREVRLLVSSASGIPEILDPGLEQATSQGEYVVGLLPPPGWTTLTLTLEVGGEVEVEASSVQWPGQPGALEAILFAEGILDQSLSEFTTSRNQIYAGQEGARLQVVPKDSCGAILGEQVVRIETTFGLVEPLVELDDGSYSSVFSTSDGECPEDSAELRAYVGSALLDTVLKIGSICGDLDRASPVWLGEGTESVEACAGGDIFALVKVAPRNQSGGPMPAGQQVRVVEDQPRIVMGQQWQEVDPVSGEPVYVLQVGSNRCAEEAVEIEILVGETALETRPLILFGCPRVAADGIRFSAAPSVVPADGESVSLVRVGVVDRCGNPAFGRGLTLQVVGDLDPVLSAEVLTTADALGESDDGAARVEIASEEQGSVGLRIELDGQVHESAMELVTFISDEQDIDVEYGVVSCGCATGAGDASPSAVLIVLIGLFAMVLRPKGHDRRRLMSLEKVSSDFHFVAARLGLGAGLCLFAVSACGGKLVPPQAPMLSAPSEGEAVRSPFTVVGTGVPGASMAVSLGVFEEELGTATGRVEETGAFAVDLTFPDQALGTPLWLRVTQETEGGRSEPGVLALVQGSLGNRYPTAEQAPRYQGVAYADMQIYEVSSGEFLDEIAFLEGLDAHQVVYFGEQHGTAPIHELQLLVLGLLTERHGDVALAMEHFQADKQSVLDDYLAGLISVNHLRVLGDAWDGFELYWLPLVDHMRAEGRPVIATNVPAAAIDAIKANGLSSPLAFINTWDSSSPHDPYLPPRPLPVWDQLYQDYFETGFSYGVHGQTWGMTYEEALDYFTDFAVIRDHTMGYWIAVHLEDTGDRVYFVGGDWHVRTGIATPDLAGLWSPDIVSHSLITTTRRSGFEALRGASFEGRAYADYILLHD